jgi:hypothetical protein
MTGTPMHRTTNQNAVRHNNTRPTSAIKIYNSGSPLVPTE